MRVALIWPFGFDTQFAVPLSLGFLKSNTDAASNDLRIFDCSLEGVDADSPELADFLKGFAPQVVGISSWSPMFPEALRVLAKAKELLPGVVTIMGGPHMTAYWRRAMEQEVIDFGFRGEAERGFGAFLGELGGAKDWAGIQGLIYRSAGSVVAGEIAIIPHLDDLRPPDYRFIDLDRYIALGYRLHSPGQMTVPILATRGCPYRCAFCLAPLLNGKTVRTHSADYVVGLVRYLYDEFNIRWFNFVDDNFTYHVGWCKDVCDRLASLNLKGVSYHTPNGIRFQRGDRELWGKMKRAGWHSLLIAPESGSEATIKRMNKDITLDAVPAIIREMRECGLNVQGFFILGYPGEGIEDLKKTANFINTCNFDFFYLSNFQPIPGTPIHAELVAAGEITDMTLPKNYTDGIRVYTPPQLRGFNFSAFILRTYLWYAVRHPRVFIHLWKFVGMKVGIKRISEMLVPVVNIRARKKA